MTAPAPDITSWDMDPIERERALEALDVLRVAQEMRAGADALMASAHAVLNAISTAQSERMPKNAGADHGLPFRSMAEEVASATHVSRGMAADRMHDASTLTTMYPVLHHALRRGQVSDAHVRAILAEGQRLHHDDDARRAYERGIIEFAAASTAGQTRRAARAIADKLSPREFEEIHAQAKTRRRVTVRDLDDGMSELYLLGESTIVNGVFDRLTVMARKVAYAHRAEHQREQAAAAGEPVDADKRFPFDPNRRTLDQIRADLLADILLTGAPNAHQAHTPGDTALDEIRATVQVIIPIDRLIDIDSNTGQPLLESDQPISAEAAKRLAGRAPTWDRIFITPSGQVLATDKYRPTRDQRRLLLARDGTCRFSGCTAKARSCDIDHTHDYASGGQTTLDNMGCLCESHHVLKHNTPWKVKQTGNGVYEWVSPLGFTRVTKPGSTVRFRDLTAEPAPF
ncbi:HNH endonuclease signature motif containing protein [Microbacterium indicum]|uniref:HNH endonuclease signature motif containing protein n=1 Tax=Microbacterium indicum TaxID=358100 RepID=UPI000429FE85|nr:HNH endonuclease signature motif containing protein [Microbacterium indicum]